MSAVMTHSALVSDFLAQKRIAVCGMSRNQDMGASAIYTKLRNKGYEVFAVHPETDSIQGEPCYRSLAAIPGGVDAVFIMNNPAVTEQIVKDAYEAGIRRVWMHDNTFGGSSASDAAVAYCKEQGIDVISVGCPLMFLEPDFFHACMRGFLRLSGRMPRS